MMKVSFRFILATLAATAALVGCTKEITPSFENDKVNPEGTRVIAVSFAPQTKTTLDGLQPKFEDGKDTVLISNTNALDTCVVSVKGNKATISTNLTGPLTAVYPYKAAGMNDNNHNLIDTVLVSTEQDGTFASANICMARMTGENEESLSFENKTAVFCITPGAGESTQYVEVSADGFEIANDVPTGSAYTSFETIHVAPITTDSVYVSILVPEGLTVGNLTFSDGTNVKAIKDERASTAIAAGTLYTVTNANWESTEADIPDGALKGVFSVSATKKIHFSRGNLYCSRTSSETNDWTWHFYDKQYKFNSIPTTDQNRTAQNTDTEIDLFNWGYDAVKSVDPTGTDHVGARTTQYETFAKNEDWGYVFGAESSVWRTLTTAEWQYLFSYNGTDDGESNYDNDNRRNKYKESVTICDKTNCVVLLPDNWEWGQNGVGDDWQTVYPEKASTDNPVTWSTMEAAGAVCLPAAGVRNGSDVMGVGSAGSYWSSSAGIDHEAYTVLFYNGDVYAGVRDSLYAGYSVRLVTNVSAAPAPTEPDYVVITAKYDGEDNPDRPLKWSRQNLAITDSGKKSWKGGNTETAVKVPGTNEDVKVGDYFQWAASYGGYNVTENQEPDSLLIYTLFTNTGCGESEDKFTFIGSKQFNQANAPYGGTSYTKYTSSGEPTLEPSDDVASIILGGTWRMPTSVEFKALKDATYWKWEDGGYYVYDPQSDDAGKINDNGTGTYDKSNALLFFPAAGYGNYPELNYAGTCGGYWSSTFNSSGMTNYAYRMEFNSDDVNPQYEGIRSYGFSVRPVSD